MKNYRFVVLVMLVLLSSANLLSGTRTEAAESHLSLVPGNSVIKRVYIDRSSSHDPGTIVVVLKNGTEQPAKIGKIMVNGVAIKDWPAPSDPVLWHRITQQELKPGQNGLVLLKLAQYTSGMIRLVVEINDTPQTILLSASDSETVRVAAIRYDPNGTYMNVFVTNTGKSPEPLTSIDLDEKTIWAAPQGGLVVKSGATEVARVSLTESLKAGQEIQLFLHVADRVLGIRDRAIPGFRISIESGDPEMAKRIHADPLVLESFQFREEQATTNPAHEAPSLAKRQGSRWSLVHVSHGSHVSRQKSDLACVFACPTHATDSYHTSAYLAMMAQHEVEKEPCWQSFVHACRSQPLRGLAMFGQLADCVRFNGQLKTSVSSKSADRDEVPSTVYQLVSYAVKSASPSLALPMIPVEKDRALFPRRAPLALEARQMAYAAISAGAGGLVYRIMEKDWGKESRDQMIDEVTAVNNEVRQLRDYLAMGFPRAIATSNDPKIQVTCIDAMPKGLVLIVINHDLERSAPELPPTVAAKEHRNVTITVDVPDGFSLGTVHEIYDTSSRELSKPTMDSGQLRIVLPSLGSTKILVLEAGI